MVPRRQFLGSIAACFVASGSTASFASMWPGNPGSLNDLKWGSVVIESLPQNAAYRSPVITGVSLQKNGDLLAIVGDDHVIGIYDTRRQIYVEHLKRHTDWVRASEFSPDGTKLATAGNDRALMLWNVSAWSEPTMIQRHPEAIIDVAFSHSGTELATVGFDEWLRIYDVQSGDQVQKIECPCPDIHAVAYSADDQMLAAGGRCGTIRLWKTSDHSQVTEFKAHRQRIRSIEFTSDKKIVSAGDDQVVCITDPNNPGLVRSFPRHASKLYATKLLDDGLIATAGSDNQIHIWQISDLQKVGTLKGHTGTVTSLAYSDKKLVSGSYDTHVRVWDTEQHTSIQQRTTELGNGWNPALK